MTDSNDLESQLGPRRDVAESLFRFFLDPGGPLPPEKYKGRRHEASAIEMRRGRAMPSPSPACQITSGALPKRNAKAFAQKQL